VEEILMVQVILWTLIGFVLGSLPFSVWLGRLFLKQDVRRYGDGNPGGANAWRAGGWALGLLVVLLDIAKGLVPVLLARANGVDGWGLVPVALAPIVGHAASPFLGFRGGKALATTGGVWIALIGGWAFVAYAVFALCVLALQTENAWTGVSGTFGFLIYSLATQSPPYLAAIAVLNVLLLIWKHLAELRRPLRLRPWAANLLGRRQA
jgi:glycerol-3-phosphate acyltransferase PlsY